ncbi:MFS transporter [Mucilaginibacter rubeus]|uniref:MFS transporter n=1 Tax=Mucilaginibacter rubeus TaxID=2027860 RepID=A0AAE6JFQ7_9SPHI|nr:MULTISPECIES: MFS transporter [Mucilaginibacter]QEM04917.1 MFS transporter [Mucilaginibacter rubeus]QEM17511.1 MFS transporter [Mucilaginibacter gossypii]QTE45968.1 MFS transporter [Mucilaginibacter rubeus]QTE52565.1 MFS transporter [Mucilaginibacter rubeus]QTE57654.1 MFS transporter [Mucilaginibacter rubeus]
MNSKNEINIDIVRGRERLLWVLSAATFVIFFQAYMIAPLIPKMASLFKVPEQTIGYLIPAYLIPYAITTLFYGLLSDRISAKVIIKLSLLAFVVLTALTATAHNAEQLIWWRLATGVGASGVVPIALALMGRFFPYEERGRPLGWLFGAMAGGAAFGSTLGVIAEPLIGWRFLFIGVAGLGFIILIFLYFILDKLGLKAAPAGTLTLRKVLQGYIQLLSLGRGLRTYLYVFLNGLFHSGVFTWLGLYFKERYGLGELGIGLALLGYGIPGFLLGPYIGKIADRKGRRWLLPIGLAISALAVLVLVFHVPLLIAALAITVLSLGYDLTQPLLAGIVTDVGKNQPGQAMGLNVFMLFMGFGIGSFLFGQLLPMGINTALLIFVLFQTALSLIGIKIFKSEQKINGN